MANARKNSIHHNMKMRTANRSEYNDGLLRVNQRQENRLTLELEQWEKAQRMVAKGLDKESQWFKQRQSVTSLSGYNPQRIKKNSLTDPAADSYNGRLIPDYQYRNRGNVTSDPVGGEPQYDDYERSPVYTPDTERDDPKDQTDSSTSKSQRKSSSKTVEGEGKKSSTSKHGEHRKSSHTHRKSSRQHGETAGREKDNGKRDSDKPASGNSAKVDKMSLKTAITETLEAPNNNAQTEPTRSSARHGRKYGTDSSTLTTLTTSSTTNITTTSTTSASTETTTITKSTACKAPHMVPSDSKEEVHDPGDITPKLLKDLGWDGRRRYTNVWDSLSIPKYTSQVRSVRSRLQREFTQVPPSSASASKGAASAKRSARATSLT